MDNKPNALLAALRDLPDAALIPVGYVRGVLGGDGSGILTDDRLVDLTVEEVAELLDLGPSTVRYYAQTGTIEAYKRANKEWRITRQAVRAYYDRERQSFLAAQEPTGAPSAYTQRTSRRLMEKIG